jgi:hypothetical protein
MTDLHDVMQWLAIGFLALWSALQMAINNIFRDQLRIAHERIELRQLRKP